MRETAHQTTPKPSSSFLQSMEAEIEEINYRYDDHPISEFTEEWMNDVSAFLRLTCQTIAKTRVTESLQVARSS